MRGASALLERMAMAAWITGVLSLGVRSVVHPVPDWVMPVFFASMGAFVVLVLLYHLLGWDSGGRSDESPQWRLETQTPVGNLLEHSPPGEHAATHVYREESVRDNRASELVGAVVVVGVVASLPVTSIVEGFNHGLTRGDALVAAFWVGVAFTVLRLLHKDHYYYTCGEIRLSDDGTCEFETRRRLIRLDVNEISSVKYSRGDDSDRERYTVRFPGGKVRVSDRMTQFPGFLARLERMNPAADLGSFPREGWPAVRTAPPVRGVSRFIGSALFPLIIVLALAWIAVGTLTGN